MTETSIRPDHLPRANAALWDWIEKQGLNQRDAAKLFKFPFPTLNHYLHNRRRPGLARLNHIFQLTGIPVTLWLDTRVAKARKPTWRQADSRQCLQAGNR